MTANTKTATKPVTRGGGRAGRRARRGAGEAAFDRAWRHWVRTYAPIEPLSADQVEAIQEASLKVLQETGMKVLSPAALTHYRAAGFDVAGDRVRFDPDGLRALVAQAPEEITFRAWGADRDVTVGGNRVGICTTGGTPNFSDMEGGRRPGSLELLHRFCKLAQAYDVIHMIGPFVEPQDVALPVRHLEMTRAAVTLTDKVPFVFYRGTEAVADAFEIIRLANGLSDEDFTRTPCSYGVANSNSPLQLDALMCGGIIDAARAGQVMVLTPFTLAGAMAPVTMAGALVQQNAEALAGISLAQAVRPGAPVIYGSFTSNVDMRTGSPAFGTPEYTRAAWASGQLARLNRLPMRSSGVTASNTVDAQAAYEHQMSLWGALMGGAHMILHGAGWLEGGLTASAEKFVVDVEQLQMFAELFKPLQVNTETLAVDAIADVGPGGHFFGTGHTIDRFETAFYSPLVSDWSNFENWRDRGSQNAMDRANRIYREAVRNYEPPPMAHDRAEAIDAFIARRVAEGGADLER
ncbi:MAG: trimethylamine methyltransferase family protein [Pseudomonadota bacterium]